jgi:hypothetical protein
MPAVSADVRNLVRDRAGNRCEYCRLAQADEPFLRFHIEHVVARQHGGPTELTNLALACHHCNLHKGPNLTGIDPQTDTIVPLYHPREQRWPAHFSAVHGTIVGLSATGRATVRVLAMNAAARVELRNVGPGET